MIMMTRIHFNAIAESFKRTKPTLHWTYCPATGTKIKDDRIEQWRKSVKDMTLMLKRMNPRFNVHTFLKACGVSADNLVG